MSEKYTKDFLVREIATRASFTIGDAKTMFDAFEEIVQEIVAEHSDLLVGGLFHIYVHEVLPHDGFNLSTKKEEHRDTTYRLTIKPSTTLKKIAKNGNASLKDE
jgi:nucleoid DNA-binding protein